METCPEQHDSPGERNWHRWTGKGAGVEAWGVKGKFHEQAKREVDVCDTCGGLGTPGQDGIVKPAFQIGWALGWEEVWWTRGWNSTKC